MIKKNCSNFYKNIKKIMIYLFGFASIVMLFCCTFHVIGHLIINQPCQVVILNFILYF